MKASNVLFVPAKSFYTNIRGYLQYLTSHFFLDQTSARNPKSKRKKRDPYVGVQVDVTGSGLRQNIKLKEGAGYR